MPTILNTAEGWANGATITTGGTGSGDAWNTVSPGVGSTHQASDERAAHGTKSYEMVYAIAGGAHRLMKNFVEAGRLVTTGRFYLEDVPTDFEDFGGVRHASGNMCVLTIGADGKFVMINSAGAAITGTPNSRATNVVPINQWITVQIEVRKGTTTTNGLLGYRYFLGTEPTGTPVFEWTSSAVNAGTLDSASVWWGRSTSRNQARTVWYDTLQATSLASGWPAVYQAPNTGPSITLLGPAFGLEPGNLQSLTINASDPDGTIVSSSVTQVGGSPTVTILGTGFERQYVVPATLEGSTLQFNAQVTDDDGASTTSATISHEVLPSNTSIKIGGVEIATLVETKIGGEWV